MQNRDAYERHRRSMVTTITVTIVLALGLLAWHITANYRNTVKEAGRDLLGYATALNEHAARVFGEAERTVDGIADRISARRGAVGRPSEKELHAILKTEIAGTPQAAAALIIDREGRIRAYSEEYPVRRIDVSDRDFFLEARDHAGTERFISRPVKTRTNNKWRFVISKRISDERGGFAGLIAVSFKPEYFDNFYRLMNIGASARINIMRTDGNTLIVSPLNDASYEQNFSGRDLFKKYLPAAPTGFYRTQAFGYDRSDRFAAYARTPGEPYFALVSVRTDEILAPWRSQSLRQVFLVAVLVAILSVMGMLLARQITRLAGAERALRLQGEIARNIAEGVYLVSVRDLTIVYANAKMEQIFGYGPGEMTGKHVSIINAPSAGDPVRTATEIERTLQEEGAWRGEVLNIRKDGTHFWGRAAISKLDHPEYGEVYVSLHMDITARKRAEDALRENEKRLNDILDNVGAYIFIKDSQYRYTYVNRAVCDLFHHTKEEIVGKSDSAFFSGPSVDEIMQSDRRVIERGETVTREEINLTASEDRPRTYWAVKIPLRDSSGTIYGLCGISTDITDLQSAEAALRESEARFRSFMESAPSACILLDADLKYLYFNKAARELTGVSLEEAFGRNMTEIFPGVEGTDRYAGYRRVLSTGKPLHVEDFRPGGVFGDRRFSMRAFRVGSNLGLIWTDITELKKAGEALRQSEELMRNVFDSVDSGFVIVDRDYRIRNANRAYCQQAGLPHEAVVGNHCYQVSHNRSRPCYEEGEECAVSKAFATGDPHTVCHQHHDADGNILYVETKAFPLKDAAGSVVSVIESINNITEKHLLEEERLKTQKLEAIGILAGGIAHDFNNLLQGVFGFISLAKLTSDDREQSVCALSEAEKALHQSVRLTNQLLTFSKGGKPVKRPVDVRPVIESGAKFALSGSRSDYRIDIDPDLWMMEADEGQICQVIQNIVLNADQAMPEGGRVEISARNLHAQGKGQIPGLAKGTYVEITVKDSGIGIPEHYLGRIFDPYFTTKEKGSGLGLATSYSIIKSHNGAITVRSEAGRGTTFSIYLPADTAATKETHPQPTATEVAGPAGKVLVMDDEQVIRDVAGALISALGHTVEYAANGQEAVEKYEAAKRSGRKFDVVILDLTIRGGMGGAETLEKLLEIDPDVKAVVSSGYSDDAVTANYREQGFRAFLKKPYDVTGLGELLNTMLAVRQ